MGTGDSEGKLIFHGIVGWYVALHVQWRNPSPSEALSPHLVASTIDYKHNIGPTENALHTDEGLGCRRVSAGKGREVACEGAVSVGIHGDSMTRALIKFPDMCDGFIEEGRTPRVIVCHETSENHYMAR